MVESILNVLFFALPVLLVALVVSRWVKRAKSNVPAPPQEKGSGARQLAGAAFLFVAFFVGTYWVVYHFGYGKDTRVSALTGVLFIVLVLAGVSGGWLQEKYRTVAWIAILVGLITFAVIVPLVFQLDGYF